MRVDPHQLDGTLEPRKRRSRQISTTLAELAYTRAGLLKVIYWLGYVPFVAGLITGSNLLGYVGILAVLLCVLPFCCLPVLSDLLSKREQWLSVILWCILLAATLLPALRAD